MTWVRDPFVDAGRTREVRAGDSLLRRCADNVAVRGSDDDIEWTAPRGTQQREHHSIGPDRYFVLVERAAYEHRYCVRRGNPTHRGPRIDRRSAVSLRYAGLCPRHLGQRPGLRGLVMPGARIPRALGQHRRDRPHAGAHFDNDHAATVLVAEENSSRSTSHCNRSHLKRSPGLDGGASRGDDAVVVLETHRRSITRSRAATTRKLTETRAPRNGPCYPRPSFGRATTHGVGDTHFGCFSNERFSVYAPERITIQRSTVRADRLHRSDARPALKSGSPARGRSTSMSPVTTPAAPLFAGPRTTLGRSAEKARTDRAELHALFAQSVAGHISVSEVQSVDSFRSSLNKRSRRADPSPTRGRDNAVMTNKDVELQCTRALHIAGENYGEIDEIAGTASDRDEAIRRVMDRLRIAERPARAVMGLKLEDLTVTARAAMRTRYQAAVAEEGRRHDA